MVGARSDVIIRCDGGHAIGLGHVKRCLALADALARGPHLSALFAGRFEPAAAELVLRQGFPLTAWPEGSDEAHWLARLVAREAPRALVWDSRSPLAAEDLARLRPALRAIVTIDDAGPRRLVADLAVLPPTWTAQSLDWTGFAGHALIGWDWVPLALRPPPRDPAIGRRGPPWRVLVSMGGSDPAGLTQRVARALLPLAARIRPLFVVGPAFADPEGQARALAALWPSATVALRPPDLVSLMAEADCAVVAYGVTAQELAAAGVPALYLGLSDDHVASADALEANGAGRSLGRHDHVSDGDVCEALEALIDDERVRAGMAAAGPRLIDGQGAERLAARIGALIGPSAS